MRKRLVIGCIGLTMALAACGESLETRPSDWDVEEPAVEIVDVPEDNYTHVDEDPVETYPVDSDEGSEVEVDDNAQALPSALPICRPRALSWIPEYVPTLEQDEIDACGLKHVQTTSYDNGLRTQSTEYIREANTIERVHMQNGRETRRTKFELSELSELSGQVQILSVYDTSEWATTSVEYDLQGRLLTYLNRSSNRKVDIEQQWQDDLLVSRKVVTVSYGAPWSYDEKHYSWTYDEHNRLIVAALNDGSLEKIEKAMWSYDEYGYPAEVIRLVNDVKVMQQNWDWSSEGELQSRTIFFDPYGLASSELAGATYSFGLDDFEPGYARQVDYMTNPWSDAHMRARDGECLLPPTSIGHGFPEHEAEYDLGWQRDKRPYGVGFAYGYYGYGWGYGQSGWFGHSGVAGYWPGLHPGQAALKFEVLYDEEGRMFEEVIDVVARPQYSYAYENLDQVVRQRSFCDKGVALDAVTIDFEDGTQRQRELAFERSDNGGITQRTLKQGGEVIAKQQWTYDECGEIAAHDIWYTSANESYEYTLAFHMPEESLSQTPNYSFYRKFEEGCRLALEYERSWQFPYQLINRREYAYDNAGNLVSKSWSDDRTVVYEYDAQGNLLTQSYEYSTGAHEPLAQYEYDASHRLTASTIFTSGNVYMSTEYDYFCAR